MRNVLNVAILQRSMLMPAGAHTTKDVLLPQTVKSWLTAGRLMQHKTVEEWNKEMAERLHEPLIEELQPYVVDTERIGRWVKHPYVNMPFTSAALPNDLYRHKQASISDAVERKDWEQYVWLHERPWRPEALLTISDELGDHDYWDLVGQVWIDTEFPHVQEDTWLTLLSSDRPHRDHIMEDDDRETLNNLRETGIDIYRGVGFAEDDFGEEVVGLDGFSWTMDRSRAEWFARRFGGGFVVVATVDRADIIAVFLGRSEAEVLLLPDCPSLNVIETVDTD